MDIAYYTGQGKVYLATRIAGGAISSGFTYVGDCDSLVISQNQKFDDIEESTSGNRLVAAHIPVGTSLSTKMNCLQWSSANLQAAVYGAYSGAVPAGSVSNELQNGYNNSLLPLANPQVSSVVGKLSGVTGTIQSIAVLTGGTGYTPGIISLTLAGSPGTGATAKAYVNAAGVIQSAFVVTAGSGYVAPTATAATGTGATFQVNMGAASLTLNTDYTVNPATGSINVLPGSKLIPPQPTSAQATAANTVTAIGTSWNYSYAGYVGRIDAFTQTSLEVALRFEGLNIADGGNPVIVSMYRNSLNLAKTLSLIEAKHGTLELDGMLLPDASYGAGMGLAGSLSQFYNAVKV